MKSAVWFILFLFAFAGHADAACESPDNVKMVSGKEHCFQIVTYYPKSTSSTLTVALHGSLSRGGDADYIRRVARRAARYGSVGVAMALPGYTIDGRTSSGVAIRDKEFSDKYTIGDMNSVAAAVANLKKHHGAKRIIMVGHSFGAGVSAVITGNSAPLVDVAILVGCPCDLDKFRYSHGREPYPNGENPIYYMKGVPKTSRIIAINGARDKAVQSFIPREYIEKARQLGLNAEFHEVPKAGHGFRRLWHSEGREIKNVLREVIK